MKFLSVRQLVAQSGRSEDTIRRMIREGKIKVERIGYHLLVPLSELTKLQQKAKTK